MGPCFLCQDCASPGSYNSVPEQCKGLITPVKMKSSKLAVLSQSFPPFFAPRFKRYQVVSMENELVSPGRIIHVPVGQDRRV